MKKSNTSDLRSDTRPLVTITAAIIFSVIIMISLFAIYFNKVYSSVLQKDMEQIEWTSHYVTKLIHTEIQHSVDILRASAEMFHADEDSSPESMRSSLQEIREGLHFEKMGVTDLNGTSMDDTGAVGRIEDPELFETIQNDKSYISNVMTSSDDMIIAIPLHYDDQIVGALWGYLSISSIAESIEMDKEMHRYFQIVDDNGNYISHSGNVYAFAEDMNIWEEMKRYTFADGVTVESIHQDVVNGESGYFYFSFQNQGRYVTYEPLGINNWYVFSVVVESFLKDYAENIEHIFVWLLAGLSVCVVAVFLIIGHFIRRVMKTIQIQNQEIQVKNSLLSTILKKTQDIPFEINLEQNLLFLYHQHPNESGLDYQVISDFTPDYLLKAGLIREEGYDSYKTFYETVMSGGTAEPIVLDIWLNHKWDCNKIHALTVDREHVIGFLEDYNEQMKSERTIEAINLKNQIDPLTGLYNRETFIQKTEEILRSPDSNSPGVSALFLLDLDHFKEVNDQLGHMAGDQVLQETGLILKSVVRSTDLSGRLGGDEFVLFIQNAADRRGLERCAEKLVSALNRTFSSAEYSVTVSASIGIVPVQGGESFAQLYEAADKALYEVKRTQRNGYQFAASAAEPVL